MITRNLVSPGKNQRGFTAIEMLMAVAITGLIASGVAVSTFQIFNMNTHHSNHTLAVSQVQSAGQWISHDTQMAGIVTVGISNGFPLNLEWTEYGGAQHQVSYSIADGEIKRSESGVETPIAQYIDPDETSCTWDETAGELVLTVTATVGSDSTKEQSETRIYRLTPRPG